ncbi:tetratricopeptide repeat protein [Actinacidiphila paucisporea]|uniref:tetratricopeptide repeat protein n=1 Tax=Actinacidiphila paucisporea TaxID=310782 RepID=UPI000D1A4CEA|nr:tetratricopeptide repeat protein [Actinacidiphila paucisporea]
MTVPGARGGPPPPDPRRIATRREFGRELTLLRLGARLSVRSLAKAAGMPASTLNGYLSGTNLPGLAPEDQLRRILRAAGVTRAGEVQAWEEAYWRVKGTVGEPPAGQAPRPGEPGAVLSAAGAARLTVSTRPPVGRLDHEPALRGRDALVHRLGAAAAGPRLPGEPGVHVLHGLGGCGKSTVALSVARQVGGQGVRTWWVAADSPSAVTAGMLALALELGASADELRLGSLPDVLAGRLRGVDGRWLLVLDNADDPPDSLALPGQRVTDGAGWLTAPPQSGTVVVTTRDGTPATWGAQPPAWLSLHRMGGLDQEQGALVLRELAGPGAGSGEEAESLSARLGGLPLALASAGRYLAEAREIPAGLAAADLPRGFAAYQEALDREAGGELLTAVPPGTPATRRRHVTVARTWELSLDLLDGRGLALARPLLRLLACLGPSPVPYGLLLRADLLAGSPPFSRLPAGGAWDALRGLDGLGLITLSRDADPPVLTLHTLVRDTTRQSAAFRAQLDDYLAPAMALLRAATATADPKAPADWDLWGLLADHCAAPLDLLGKHGAAGAGEGFAEALGLARRAAGFLRAAGHLARAEEAYLRALEAARDRTAGDDPLVLGLRHDLARVRYDRGRPADAERDFRQVLAERRRRLGPEHPDTLVSQHYLARTLRESGRLDEAGELFAATLLARVRLLGELHPDTLTSRNGVADQLRVAGDLPAARAAYEQVLALRGKVLGDLHPATLVTRHHLADLLHAMDELPRAEAELRHLARVNDEVRGERHPRTLAVRHSLVAVLHDLGTLDEAEKLARALLAARRELLGATHPATLLTRHRLGLVLLDRGAVDEAREELTAVLDDRLRLLGPAHPDTVLSQDTAEAVRRRGPTDDEEQGSAHG